MSVRAYLNRLALPLGLLGVTAVAVYNWRVWRRDRAFQTVPVSLPPLDVWSEVPLVTVLVAAWNEVATIDRHIESFAALRYPHKELVLCAGGEDGTLDRARLHALDNVILLEQQPGEGKQAALRRGLKVTGGEIIFLTDGDCLLDDDSFERTLSPLINNRESVATGAFRPLPEQQHNPFVQYQQALMEALQARYPQYTTELSGGNMAIRRDVLRRVGDFATDAAIGTDYHLMQQLAQQRERVRFVMGSRVSTEFPPTIKGYRRQRSRWLRNHLAHGTGRERLRHGRLILLGLLIAWGMLLLPLTTPVVGPVALALWVVLFSHVLLSRIRLIGRGLEKYPGLRVRLPFFILVDWFVVASTAVDILFPNRRHRW